MLVTKNIDTRLKHVDNFPKFVGTVKITIRCDIKNELVFYTTFLGFGIKMPKNAEKNSMIQELFKLYDKLEQHAKDNPDDKFDPRIIPSR